MYYNNTSFLVVMNVFFSTYPIMPIAASMISSVLNVRNETFEKTLCYPVEYFFDEKEHFMFPFLHVYCVVTTTGIVVSSCGSFYIITTYHIISRFNAIG